MLAKLPSGAVRSERKSQGYFLFELLISALMIAAIVVLAFPTYQDFTPEVNVIGEISIPEQTEQSSDSTTSNNSASLTADQQENESVSSPETASNEENSTS